MNTISVDAKYYALAIWQEQLAAGLGEPGEVANIDNIDAWLENHSVYYLGDAANGDVSAIAEVRREAGLPILS